MLLGAMNHPARDPVDEIERVAGQGFDFVDLTLEPPAAASSMVDVAALRRVFERTGLRIVGHTAYYLPIASPFAELRECALQEFGRCAAIFASLGATVMNVHPDPVVSVALMGEEWVRRQNVESLRALVEICRPHGLRLMLENHPQGFNSPEQLGAILTAVPELALHWDVGHGNLLVRYNQTEAVLQQFGDRLAHVHISDNKGGDRDLHLPMGVGTIDWRWALGALQRAGYDGTITIEAFIPDSDYLVLARQKVRRLWDELVGARA
jgi:sugar phosphate isomerase/epimerase